LKKERVRQQHAVKTCRWSASHSALVSSSIRSWCPFVCCSSTPLQRQYVDQSFEVVGHRFECQFQLVRGKIGWRLCRRVVISARLISRR